uniref:Uncharacterized protein n=1 Tax=Aegilops tauschii subsp. strangulata TaxID=200361 RepID=A0A453PJM0_AEGTS
RIQPHSPFLGRVLKWVVDRKSLTVDAMRFQAAYAGVIASMTDKSEWPEVDLGFKTMKRKKSQMMGSKKSQMM